MEEGAETGRPRRGAAVGRVLRDGAVRSALLAGLVIGLSAAFVGARYPWQFAVIGAVWLVATIVRIRNVVVAPLVAGPRDDDAPTLTPAPQDAEAMPGTRSDAAATSADDPISHD
ncbi:hypothetical protein [Cellulomonas persica]|uniref:hypothetical protein n=1 Tax=Cellulomonas persica TaxID=76861 RepID=UPI0011BFDC2F|nr:hypothetical protein [Cellulomonas persica]